MIKALIIVILILIILYLLKNKEHLYEPVDIEVIPTKASSKKAYIKLYDQFNKESLIFNFEPLLAAPANNYIRKIVKVNLKSIELNLPKKNDGNDDYRVIEIWSMYPGDTTASMESDFYNSYTERDNGRTGNPFKYKLLAKLKAGEKVSANIMEPVKKVFIYGRL
jgi:hypothetical protein